MDGYPHDAELGAPEDVPGSRVEGEGGSPSLPQEARLNRTETKKERKKRIKRWTTTNSDVIVSFVCSVSVNCKGKNERRSAKF